MHVRTVFAYFSSLQNICGNNPVGKIVVLIYIFFREPNAYFLSQFFKSLEHECTKYLNKDKGASNTCELTLKHPLGKPAAIKSKDRQISDFNNIDQMVYRVSSRTPKVMQRNPALRNQKYFKNTNIHISLLLYLYTYI